MSSAGLGNLLWERMVFRGRWDSWTLELMVEPGISVLDSALGDEVLCLEERYGQGKFDAGYML
jgi:hypothetical protein